jgi:carboxyl-terminal processing protease
VYDYPVMNNLRSKWLRVFLFLLVSGQVRAAIVPDALAIYDQTTEIVTRKFYDRTFRGLPWEKLVADHREKLNGPVDGEKLKATLNDLLGSLRASHTEFLSADDQEYWALESIFSGKLDGAPLRQVGAWFTMIDGRWFIKTVFNGSAAEKAGLVSGDEIVSVDGRPFEPVKSFADWPAGPRQVAYRRARNGPERVVAITPEFKSIQNSLLGATLASSRLLLRGKTRIGYFHLWTGTHAEFREALARTARDFSGVTDALILDLRDGFGGCEPSWLNPFFDHDDEGHSLTPVYTKPVVVLINDGTRSGKEWLAHIFKESKRATLIGSRTAGHFLAGQPFEIRPGQFLLYLAVNGDGPTGVNLEGRGVAPDVEISSELPYSAGKDLPLEEAIARLAATDPAKRPD